MTRAELRAELIALKADLAEYQSLVEGQVRQAVKCPMQNNGKQCYGVLMYISTFQLFKVTNAFGLPLIVDTNTESFECPICGAKLKRTWKWESK